jgi:hypothetical protein
MHELGVVYRNITRADGDVATRLGELGSATVHEAMGRTGLLKPHMRPIYERAQVGGTAVTVLLQPGDNWMLHVAAEQVQPGDVVVAACTAVDDQRARTACLEARREQVAEEAVRIVCRCGPKPACCLPTASPAHTAGRSAARCIRDSARCARRCP